MTLAEIMEKICGLPPDERAVLRRELDEMMSKHDMSATPETVAKLKEEQAACHDERGLPVEDVLDDPKPKDGA